MQMIMRRAASVRSIRLVRDHSIASVIVVLSEFVAESEGGRVKTICRYRS
jgi:hypothetical protein